jgi:hypothetical protein
MKTTKLSIAIALILSAAMASGSAFAAKPTNPGGGGNGGGGSGGGGGGGVVETGANNLSFPVIFGDNVGPAAFPADNVWKFAAITDPATQCVQENNVTVPVPANFLCYYGRQVTVVSETGTISFSGDPKVWWLQKRTSNFWKALSVGHDANTPLAVSAVDVGDLLESSPSIQARQIRVEFNLLQHVDQTDPELGRFVVPAWGGIPAPCQLPTVSGESIGCFAALGMSGAVPGTQQSINEMQGAEFGPGMGTNPGTQTLLDPSLVRLTTPDVGGIQALVYSNCARLVIQKIDGSPVWDKTAGQWSGSGVGAPMVNIAAYTGAWGTEVTSGGSIVYGYNWNAKTAATGTYRLTFVLDGNDATGPQCTTALATKFDPSVTRLVNGGEANQSHLVYAGDSQLGDEGGLAYIDLALSTKGGGGGKPQK